MDQCSPFQAFADCQEDVGEVSDGLHAASGSWSARRHPLEDRISAMEEPLEEAGQLVPMVLDEVVDIDEFQLNLLRQALEVPLFDLQIGHVEYLIKDLVQFHWVKVRLR